MRLFAQDLNKNNDCFDTWFLTGVRAAVISRKLSVVKKCLPATRGLRLGGLLWPNIVHAWSWRRGIRECPELQGRSVDRRRKRHAEKNDMLIKTTCWKKQARFQPIHFLIYGPQTSGLTTFYIFYFIVHFLHSMSYLIASNTVLHELWRNQWPPIQMAEGTSMIINECNQHI